MSTATLVMRRNQNLYRQPARLRLGPISASFMVIAFVSILALLYLNQVTKTSVLGYRLMQLQTQETQAQQTQDQLQVEAARLQSIQSIESSSTVSKMVAPTTVTYAQ